MCDRWELRRYKGLSTDPGKDHFEKQGIFLFFYTDETLPKIQKWWRLTYFQCFSRGWGKIGYMFEMKWTCVSPRDQHKCLLWPWPNPNRKSAILYFLLIFGDLHILSCNKTWQGRARQCFTWKVAVNPMCIVKSAPNSQPEHIYMLQLHS